MPQRLQKFPSPRWEFLLTCPIDSHLSIRIDIWFYQGFVRASHACKLPIAPMGFSHVCSLLAGRRCVHRQWHGELLIVHHHWQHSCCWSACSTQKFPLPRWDFHLLGFSPVLRLCLQGGGVRINSGTVSFSSCNITGNSAGYVRDHAQKFPSPRWDFHMFCACVCRAAVSSSTMSRVAR